MKLTRRGIVASLVAFFIPWKKPSRADDWKDIDILFPFNLPHEDLRARFVCERCGFYWMSHWLYHPDEDKYDYLVSSCCRCNRGEATSMSAIARSK